MHIMQVFLGADHRGFFLKENLKHRLLHEGIDVVDLGSFDHTPGDYYVDFARKVADTVTKDLEARGVLICGSGVGVDIVANKVDGVRSALVYDVARAIQARQHEDANVLSLAADVLSDEDAYNIVNAFLMTDFTGE